MMTCVSGKWATRFAVAWILFIFGILISIITTSVSYSLTSFVATLPSPPSATTLNDGSKSSILLTPSRNNLWSSIITISMTLDAFIAFYPPTAYLFLYNTTHMISSKFINQNPSTLSMYIHHFTCYFVIWEVFI